MSRKTTRETLLGKKRGTHDLSVGTGLVLHKMVGIIGDTAASIVADLAEWHIGGTDKTVRKTAFTNGNRSTGRSLGRTNSRVRRHFELMFDLIHCILFYGFISLQFSVSGKWKRNRKIGNRK
jgi:thiosulfate reductase cytochrome b subunit